MDGQTDPPIEMRYRRTLPKMRIFDPVVVIVCVERGGCVTLPTHRRQYCNLTLHVFRSVGQERISIRGSVCPLVRPSVGPLRLCKNRVSRLFLAAVRSYIKSNDRQICFESLLYYSVVSSVSSSICLSIHVTCSIHAETQSGRIVARSGMFIHSNLIP